MLKLSTFRTLNKFTIRMCKSTKTFHISRPTEFTIILLFLRQRRCETHTVHVLPHQTFLTLHHSALLVLPPAYTPCCVLVNIVVTTVVAIITPRPSLTLLLAPAAALTASPAARVFVVPVVLFGAVGPACGAAGVSVISVVDIDVVCLKFAFLAGTFGKWTTVGMTLVCAFYHLFGKCSLSCYEFVGDEHG